MICSSAPLRITALAAAALAPAAVMPVMAATCSDKSVQARGDPSRFEAIAKASARGNWRASVRAHPALGAPYANWNIAEGAIFNCTMSDGAHTCTAVGRPCRD
jgi:hypothetical protein